MNGRVAESTGGRARPGPLLAPAAALACALALAAEAQTPPDTLYPLPEIDGALPWDTLAGVEAAADGAGVAVSYDDAVLALDGEAVKMVGFLIPLGGGRQLLSRNSPNCPFCLPTGPEGFVELVCDEPIDYAMDAVVVAGTFQVLRDGGQGYYYRMTDVAQLDE